MRRPGTPRSPLLGRRIVLAALLAVGLANVRVAPTTTADSGSTVTLPNSVVGPGSARVAGGHPATAPLAITLVLQPNNAAQLANLLTALYDPSSPQYHHWLATGEFAARFAPTAAQIAQVTTYLQGQGLQIQPTSSQFLVAASGSTEQVEAALSTHISDYVAANNTPYYSNDTSVRVPASLSGIVAGVVGLSNTVRVHPAYVTTQAAARASGNAAPLYGAGPGGSGLTPSQTTSLYGARGIYSVGPRGQGAGKTLAVFELSGYTRADITRYEQTFFGPGENVPIVDVNVDGGPVTPVCPPGDSCGPFGPPPCTNGCNGPDYSSDIEVNADIEQQIAIAPRISGILVYNAPNDVTGQTTIDEYMRIARDNLADSISSSWGLCEPDAGFPFALAESIAFQQMAAQGQSMFTSSGDTGAFDCLRGSGAPVPAVGDPASQPFVTGVGGTSFEGFDPRHNPTPSYPYGFETVWNVLNRCSGSARGLANCANLGASGGGNSVFWGQPAYQSGPGVLSATTSYAPSCSAAAAGQPCREVPDVSANADEYTPYAEYCTGSPVTNSTCATFSMSQTVPGWFGIGGTSLSSPLWSGIIALSDSYHGTRYGEASYGLYRLFRALGGYGKYFYFHDVTGVFQTENNNGLFPTTPNYDEATGIGTPLISAIATSRP